MSEQWTEEQDAAFRAATERNTSDNGRTEAIAATTSWWPVDLAPIVKGIEAGEIVGPTPQLMARTDGPCLLYPGEVHSLAGEPETGKGWIALAAAATVLAAGGHVLYLDCEDAPASIVSRLLALDVPASHIVDQFAYVRPTDPFTAATLTTLLAAHTYTLAVIDGLSEAYALLGLDPYSNVDAAKFLASLARPIANAGAAVLLIDHVIKAKEARGRYALGAQHKLAGIAVAYSTHAIQAPSRTSPGHIKLKVEKDRHGHVRSHANANTIANVHITPDDNGNHVTVALEAPEISTNEAGEFRPTILMTRVWNYVHDQPGTGLNAIKRDVEGRDEWIAKALHLLIAEGYIDRQKQGQTYQHHTLNEYADLPSPTESQPSPGTGLSNRVPESPPIRDSDSDSVHPNQATESHD